jgi:alkylation response protein AidB-like acyl-CoA dehydrogenase
LTRSPDGARVSGALRFVPELDGADRVLVVAVDERSIPVLVDLDVGDQGASIDAAPVVDATRRFGDLDLAEVPVRPDAIWSFDADPALAVAGLVARGSLAVACDSLGLAERMLAATVDYVARREQFGRPIGSFQAVKHACADMAVQLSIGRALVNEAVDDLAGGATGHPPSVAMAKAYVTGAAVDIAGAAMQLHGGIGYTWEGGIHRFLKRAVLNRSLFGSRQQASRFLARRHLTAADHAAPPPPSLLPTGARP